jgi:type IV secretory pathway VirB10-like protein
VSRSQRRLDVRTQGRRRVDLATRVAAAATGVLAVVFGVAMASHAPAAATQQQQQSTTGRSLPPSGTPLVTTTRPQPPAPVTTTPLQPPAQPPAPVTGGGDVGTGGS